MPSPLCLYYNLLTFLPFFSLAMFPYFDFTVEFSLFLRLFCLLSLRFLSPFLYSPCLTVPLTSFYILDISFLSLVVIPVPLLSMSTYTIRFLNIRLLYSYNKYTSSTCQKTIGYFQTYTQYNYSFVLKGQFREMVSGLFSP